MEPKDINIAIVIVIVMTTTIAVKESTLQLLSRMKKRLDAGSIDETIVRILRKVENVPLSRFGSQPKLKQFKENERSNSHEL